MPSHHYLDNKNLLTEHEATQLSKPSFFKQIVGGYFANGKLTEGEKEEKAIVMDMINYSEKPIVPGFTS